MPNLKEYNQPTSIIFCNPYTNLSSIPSSRVTDSLPSIVPLYCFYDYAKFTLKGYPQKHWCVSRNLVIKKSKCFPYNKNHRISRGQTELLPAPFTTPWIMESAKIKPLVGNMIPEHV